MECEFCGDGPAGCPTKVWGVLRHLCDRCAASAPYVPEPRLRPIDEGAVYPIADLCSRLGFDVLEQASLIAAGLKVYELDGRRFVYGGDAVSFIRRQPLVGNTSGGQPPPF